MTAISTRSLLSSHYKFFDERMNDHVWRMQMWIFIRVGLPINDIKYLHSSLSEDEELIRVLVWDDMSFWMSPRRVGETWPIVAWWDFQRWAFK